MTLFYFMLIFAVLGQGMDVITTNAGLKHGAVETSGVVAWAIKYLGFASVVLIKTVGLAAGLPVLFAYLGQPLIGSILGIAAGGAGAVAGAINYTRLKKAKIPIF